MTVALEELEANAGKEVVLHVLKGDNQMEELTGTIKKATVAGVAFKPKGKSDLQLLTVDQIEEIQAAPSKPKSVTQKKIDLVPEGGMRQHLADRHGIELKWCKEATEAQAVEFHNSIDHSVLGHVHVDKKSEKANKERAAALADSGAAE